MIDKIELIGREKELKNLKDRLDSFLESAGRDQAIWINVYGEPGIGKSRLLSELVDSVQSERPLMLFSNRGLPLFNQAYGSIVSALAADIELRLWEKEYVKKEKLESRLVRLAENSPGLREKGLLDVILYHVGGLLGISYGDPGTGFQYRLGGRKQEIFRAVRNYLNLLRPVSELVENGQHSLPLIIWIEDIDRADKLSCELLVNLVQKKDSLQPLIILSSSTSAVSGMVSALNEFQQYSLGEISKLSRKKILNSLDEDESYPSIGSSGEDLIAEGAPGVPGLVYQAYLILAEQKKDKSAEGKAHHQQLMNVLKSRTRALNALDLSYLYKARLDNLDHLGRTIMQCIALLGPFCSREMLAALLTRTGYSSSGLEQHLEELEARQFIAVDRYHRGAELIRIVSNQLSGITVNAVPPDRVSAVHHVIAELMRDSAEDNVTGLTIELGFHLMNSYFLKEDWAVEYLSAAGDRLIQLEDFSMAAAVYEEAGARLGLECAEGSEIVAGARGEKFCGLMVDSGRALLGGAKVKEAFSRLLSVLQLARDHSFDKPRAKACLYLGDIMLRRGDWNGAQRFFDEGAECAIRIGDSTLEASCLNSLVAIHLRREDFHSAREVTGKILEILEDQQKTDLALDSMLNMAYIHQRLGDSDKALELYDRILELSAIAGREPSAVTALSNTGRIKFDRGLIHEAMECFHRALELLREYGDIQQTANWLGYIGSIYYSMDEYETAIDYYKQALKLSEISGDTRSRGVWLANLGNAYYEIKEVTRALNYYLNALNLAREEQDYSYVSTLMSTIGVYYFNLRQYEQAKNYFNESLSLASDIGNLPISVQNILYRGAILAAQGDMEAAGQALDEGQKLAENNSMVEHQAVAQLFRGQLELSLGNIDQAAEHCRKAAEFSAPGNNSRLKIEIEKALRATRAAKEPDNDKEE